MAEFIVSKGFNMADAPIVYGVVDVWHDGKLPLAVYMGMLMSDPLFGYTSSKETGIVQIPEVIRKCISA